jgi:hypothetical protein
LIAAERDTRPPAAHRAAAQALMERCTAWADHRLGA